MHWGRREKGEVQKRKRKEREGEREMNIIYYLRTNCLQVVKNYGNPSSDGDCFLKFWLQNSNWGVFTPPNANALIMHLKILYLLKVA